MCSTVSPFRSNLNSIPWSSPERKCKICWKLGTLLSAWVTGKCWATRWSGVSLLLVGTLSLNFISWISFVAARRFPLMQTKCSSGYRRLARGSGTSMYFSQPAMKQVWRHNLNVKGMLLALSSRNTTDGLKTAHVNKWCWRSQSVWQRGVWVPKMSLQAAMVWKQSGEHKPGKYFVWTAHPSERLAEPRPKAGSRRHGLMAFEELRFRNCTRSIVPWSGSSELEALGLSFLPTVIKRWYVLNMSKFRTFVPRSSYVLWHNSHVVKGSQFLSLKSENAHQIFTTTEQHHTVISLRRSYQMNHCLLCNNCWIALQY